MRPLPWCPPLEAPWPSSSLSLREAVESLRSTAKARRVPPGGHHVSMQDWCRTGVWVMSVTLGSCPESLALFIHEKLGNVRVFFYFLRQRSVLTLKKRAFSSHGQQGQASPANCFPPRGHETGSFETVSGAPPRAQYPASEQRRISHAFEAVNHSITFVAVHGATSEQRGSP